MVDSAQTLAHDPLVFAENMTEAAGEWYALLQECSAYQLDQMDGGAAQEREQQDATMLGQAFTEAFTAMMRNPSAMAEQGAAYWQGMGALMEEGLSLMSGGMLAPLEADKRFKNAAWQEHPFYALMRRSYEFNAHWLEQTWSSAVSDNPQLARKIAFYTRQWCDAISPTNYLFTNPDAMQATLESNGENLVRGLRNMREDIKRGNGRLAIRMADEEAFALGRNLAMTPGSVVFRNKLLELIQYTPLTKHVYSAPVLLVPAWINKFYVLDLQEKNSLVRWLVEQGHTVFVISWVNPAEEHVDVTFEDYMQTGLLQAIEAVQAISQQPRINAVGYCLGGTLLSTTLAYLKAKGQEPVASATYLTTMIDFSDPGELGVFIDEAQLNALEQRICKRGYLPGSDMSHTFNLLRANDLIWSFVVNNYLLGKDPLAFDLLYWNADSTSMPHKMHIFYLRNMYLRNRLAMPGGIRLLDTPIDLTRITTPSFMLSCREDHIAPWTSTYAATGIFKGDVRFVLSASGHIAGVINPPAKEKYCYWTNENTSAPAEEWLAGAEQHAGSWWPHWQQWLVQYSGEKIPARTVLGSGDYPPLMAAPGEYVHAR